MNTIRHADAGFSSGPRDRAKDQTYFLFGLTQEQLAYTLFPLGRMTKPRFVKRHGSMASRSPKSRIPQEICFIPGGDYKQFLTAYLEEQGEAMPETAGELVSSSGEVDRASRGNCQLHRRAAQGG